VFFEDAGFLSAARRLFLLPFDRGIHLGRLVLIFKINGTAFGLFPVKISPLFKNLIEFYANGKYHFFAFLGVVEMTRCLGDGGPPTAIPSPNKKGPFLWDPFNSKIPSRLSIILKTCRVSVPFFVVTYIRSPRRFM